MATYDTLTQIIEMPQRFNDVGTVSINELLSLTGYCQSYENISEADIANALSQKTSVVNSWLTYSEDKRVPSGWYIKRNHNGTFIVGSQDGEAAYEDGIKACAAFIKNEIETLRQGILDQTKA